MPELRLVVLALRKTGLAYGPTFDVALAALVWERSVDRRGRAAQSPVGAGCACCNRDDNSVAGEFEPSDRTGGQRSL